jgi:hypothetical protein
VASEASATHEFGSISNARDEDPDPKRQKDGGGAPPKGRSDRVDGAAYILQDGTAVTWSAKTHKFLCTCHHNALCGGNRPIDRCGNSSGRTSTSLPSPAEETSRRPPSSGNCQQRHPAYLEALPSIKFIPPCSVSRSPAIVVISPGTWKPALAELPLWSGNITHNGKLIHYPFRPDSMWRRDFKEGKWAAAVNKSRVTILFKIVYSVTRPDRPMFSAQDSQSFNQTIQASTWGELEKKWLSQGSLFSGQKNLQGIEGKRFMGLNSLGLAEYWCSLTPGYEGFRANQPTRGAGEKGTVGKRQRQRIEVSLSESFELLLKRVCPKDSDLSTAFSFLQGAPSFKKLVKTSSEALEQNHPAVQALVVAYQSAVRANEKMEAKFILSLISTKNNRDVTMKIFHCTEHAVKAANTLSRLRRVSVIDKVDTSFGRFPKETVLHMEEFALRQDVVLRAAYN